MSYDFSENILVQESSGNLLHDELGWDVVYAYNQEVLGENGTLGRKSYKDILLTRYFRSSLKKLNPWITETQINEAQSTFESHSSISSLLQINEEKYAMIRDGIEVKIKKVDGTSSSKRAILIDFKNINNNHFLAVKEMKIHSELYHRRTDIVGFVNGIPLLFIELKNTTVDVQNAYDDNYKDYLDTIPHLFYYNAFLMLSNGEEAKIGTLGSKYEFFHEWKRLAESDVGNVALETMLRGVCKKENFLDLLENFILFDHSDGKNTKILARNHQYLGVNEAIEAYKERKLNNGKLGVFWHTQGSGKSYSMVFLTRKILRKFEGSPTFVILTDRDELNTQISGTFENCGLLGGTKAEKLIATSGEDLVFKLKGNPNYIFTLIQKFNNPDKEPIYLDHDVIILSDEAHRSQYGIYAENMMKLLPTASRLGFTGTPLLTNDNITTRTFGEYVSIYDFKRAVDDGATVPLFYENRGIKIKDLKNPEINERILNAIEEADIDEDKREKIEHDFEKEIHLLTSEPRLRMIAKDFVQHYSDLWTSGKAMFVCLNKVTCVRMYNYVQEYWNEEIKTVQKQLKNVSQQEAQELEKKIKWMSETEMAVVISQEQNEIQTFKKWNLDIKYHREKMVKRELDKEFKDQDSPLRIVFVCAMWLTGFDVKCLSCLYLDKPLKAHTLMQAIARANRVSEGKSNGLIIDYIGIVKALRKALAAYTANVGTNTVDPTIDKEVLINRILEVVDKAKSFLHENNFELQQLIDAVNFTKMQYLLDGANAMCVTAEIKKTFSTYAQEIIRLVKYTDRNDITEQTRKECDAITAIYKEMQKKRKHVDVTELSVEINSIISEYVELDNSNLKFYDQSRKYDISGIDFDLLRKEFSKVARKNLVMRDLEESIKQKIVAMMTINPNRVNYYERYQKIIEGYNEEQDRATIEQTFEDLMNLAKNMSEEEKRYVHEGFENDNELTFFDLLFKDDLNKNDIKKIKEVSVKLYSEINKKLKELDHWRDKEQTKATISNLIRKILYEDLPKSYSNDDVLKYRDNVFEYVYNTYA